MGHFFKKKHFVQSSNIPKEECFDFDSSDETDEMDDFFSLLLSRFGIFVAFLVGALATAVGPFCESGKTFLTLSTSEATLFPAGIGASSFMKMGGSPSMAVMKVRLVRHEIDVQLDLRFAGFGVPANRRNPGMD